MYFKYITFFLVMNSRFNNFKQFCNAVRFIEDVMKRINKFKTGENNNKNN